MLNQGPSALGSKLTSSSWSNSLMIGIYTVGRERRHVLILPLYNNHINPPGADTSSPYDACFRDVSILDICWWEISYNYVQNYWLSLDYLDVFYNNAEYCTLLNLTDLRMQWPFRHSRELWPSSAGRFGYLEIKLAKYIRYKNMCRKCIHGKYVLGNVL